MDGSSHDRHTCQSSGSHCPELAFFSTQTQILATSSVRLSSRGRSPSELAERALRGAALEGSPNALVVGALPFASSDEPALSLVRECVTGAAAWAAALAQDAPREVLTSGAVTERPPVAEYQQAVLRALAAIEVGYLEKVVLARAVDYALLAPPCRGALLAQLLRRHPNAHVFVCRLDSAGEPRRTLLGASPELLVSKRGRQVRSHPLAGSAPRSVESRQDRARATALLRCEKNRREHAFVVDAVASALSPWCSELRIPKEPTLVATPKVWHLGTPIEGTLRDADVSSLALAEILHPTPAVCGSPRSLARACIPEFEGFERGFYAGAVGYCDITGDGHWAVAIRCADMTDERLRLYAGAGIVAGADSAQELEETSVKLTTMLDALGLAQLEQVA
jgi:isochorismate synthase